MFWSAGIFGVVGVLIGLRYRAPALIPATFVAMIWGAAAGWMVQNTVGQVALMAALLTVTLHAAYLVALTLRTLSGRSLW